MGVYSVQCPECKATHPWFSGDLDQRCFECKREKKEEVMTNEQQLIEALQANIKIQGILIDYLKAEIERLKASQVVYQPEPGFGNPGLGYPVNPTPFMPVNPLQPTTTPGVNPWPQPPFIITSGPTHGSITIPANGHNNITLTGTSLPPGSVQFDDQSMPPEDPLLCAGLMR